MRRIDSYQRSAISVQLFIFIVGVGLASAEAEDASSKGSVTVRKTEDRLHFQLPPDWPIEKRGGVTGPIPIEEYLARKFSAIESRLQAIEQRFNGFDVRLRALEEQMKKQTQALQSTNTQ